ncbi:sugar transferase [Deinococcus wulumuqiensis]|uniref:sugar transferase n=1 Tax=Deinococcus wulumuqiensis TaxID=980427 RepID=UPI00137648C1|nr:sugar transferase [Deinococcus wulumuqiensis]QII22251.1 glycosyltransferase [Deinococcus wulumuqiensis R12]
MTSSLGLIALGGQVALMAKRGWRTAVSAPPMTAGQMQEFTGQEENSILPVPIEQEINIKADVKALGAMYLALRRFQPTITNVSTLKAGLIGGLAGVAARVPVYTLQGLQSEAVQGRQGRRYHVAERVAIACAHRVVCVSPSLQKRAHELGLIPVHKTVVLGVTGVRPLPPMAPELTATQRNQLGLSKDRPVIGFVGRLARTQGIPELIHAFQRVQLQVPDAALLLVGDYEEDAPGAAEVRQLIEQTPGVIRAGLVPDVSPYYPLMTVMAFPACHEGFSTMALEGAAFGLPLVMTNTAEAHDLVKDGLTGWYVPAGDPDALASALITALLDPAEARRRGEAGLQWVMEHFSPQRVQERWADYYDELLRWRELGTQHPEKRVMDILFSGLGLMLLGLPMLGLAGLIRYKLGSPVLFKQVRPGLAGQPFTMYKFRTMTDERGPDGELLPNAVRLTAFGKFLRSTSLDELPELLNILKGDMSLVGPRPLLMEYLPLYNERQARRHEVRPGLTGWAQVNGRNALSWEEKFEHDMWYVENRSFALDLKILLMTLKKVLNRDGINADGEATAPRFKGTHPS